MVKRHAMMHTTYGRLLLVWLVLSLLVGSCAGQAGAEPEPAYGGTIEVESVEGAPGDMVSITVSATPEVMVWAYDITVQYDAAVLELVADHEVTDRIEVDESSSEQFDYSLLGSDRIQVTAMLTSHVLMDQKELFTLHFKIKDDAASGAATVVVPEQLGLLYEGDSPSEATATAGGVDVTAAAALADIAIGSASGAPGTTVQVPVKAANVSGGIAAYELQMDIDPEVMKVTGVASGSGDYLDWNFDEQNGWLRVAWVDADGGETPIVTGDTLFTITLVIQSSAAAGIQTVDVTDKQDTRSFSMTSPAGLEMDKTVTAGEMTITPNPYPIPNPGPGIGYSPATGSTAKGVDVLVNGKAERAGTASTTQIDGRQVTTLVVDEAKLQQRLEEAGERAVIALPVLTGSDVVIGELNGRMVKRMEGKQAVVEVRTEHAVYKLPAGLIDIDRLSQSLGAEQALQDIKIRIEIAAPAGETLRAAEQALTEKGIDIVVPPVHFAVHAVYGDKTVEVTIFDAYVERTVRIPDGVDPSRVTTGVVVEEDGTLRHVPTSITRIDGSYYARMNSLTNSLYSVVWHPMVFADAAGHWAETAVNDMASRMIVEGTSADRFEPDRSITRAEFVAILVRALGLRPESGASSFGDVEAAAWYNGAIQSASNYGFIDGFEDGAFRPGDSITREQAIVVLSRALSIAGIERTVGDSAAAARVGAFADAASISPWALPGITDLAAAGILRGRSDSELAPGVQITRAEAATLIRRLLIHAELINE